MVKSMKEIVNELCGLGVLPAQTIMRSGGSSEKRPRYKPSTAILKGLNSGCVAT